MLEICGTGGKKTLFDLLLEKKVEQFSFKTRKNLRSGYILK